MCCQLLTAFLTNQREGKRGRNSVLTATQVNHAMQCEHHSNLSLQDEVIATHLTYTLKALDHHYCDVQVFVINIILH